MMNFVSENIFVLLLCVYIPLSWIFYRILVYINNKYIENANNSKLSIYTNLIIKDAVCITLFAVLYTLLNNFVFAITKTDSLAIFKNILIYSLVILAISHIICAKKKSDINQAVSKKIFSTIKRLVVISVLSCLGFDFISTLAGYQRVYQTVLLTFLAAYYFAEIYKQRALLPDVLISKPVGKIGVAETALKHFCQNWWKIMNIIIAVFYILSMQNNTIDIIGFISNSGLALLAMMACSGANIILLRSGGRLSSCFKRQQLPKDLKLSLRHQIYINITIISFFAYFVAAFCMIKLVSFTDPQISYIVGIITVFIKLTTQIYGIFAMYNLINAYCYYKIEKISLSKAKKAKRLKGILQLLSKCGSVLLVAVCVLMLLVNYGVSVSAIAGFLLSLAAPIALASKDAVKSLINGIVMLLENDIEVGDEITVCGIHGVIEEIGIRTMKIREISGVLHSVPYSQVGVISNKSRNYNLHYLEFYFPVIADVEQINTALTETANELTELPYMKERLLTEVIVLGLKSFDDKTNKFAVVAKAKPEVNSSIDTTFIRYLKDKLNEKQLPAPISINPKSEMQITKII